VRLGLGLGLRLVVTHVEHVTAAAATGAAIAPATATSILEGASNGTGHMRRHTAHGVHIMVAGRHAHIKGAVLVLHVVKHHTAALDGSEGHLGGRLADRAEGAQVNRHGGEADLRGLVFNDGKEAASDIEDTATPLCRQPPEGGQADLGGLLFHIVEGIGVLRAGCDADLRGLLCHMLEVGAIVSDTLKRRHGIQLGFRGAGRHALQACGVVAELLDGAADHLACLGGRHEGAIVGRLCGFRSRRCNAHSRNRCHNRAANSGGVGLGLGVLHGLRGLEGGG
jgi:hypothetical protein